MADPVWNMTPPSQHTFNPPTPDFSLESGATQDAASTGDNSSGAVTGEDGIRRFINSKPSSMSLYSSQQNASAHSTTNVSALNVPRSSVSLPRVNHSNDDTTSTVGQASPEYTTSAPPVVASQGTNSSTASRWWQMPPRNEGPPSTFNLASSVDSTSSTAATTSSAHGQQLMSPPSNVLSSSIGEPYVQMQQSQYHHDRPQEKQEDQHMHRPNDYYLHPYQFQHQQMPPTWRAGPNTTPSNTKIGSPGRYMRPSSYSPWLGANVPDSTGAYAGPSSSTGGDSVMTIVGTDLSADDQDYKDGTIGGDGMSNVVKESRRDDENRPVPMLSTLPHLIPNGRAYTSTVRWVVTSDITLYAINGDQSNHIFYPRNPAVSELLYSLQEPNGATLSTLSAATTHHLQFYGYGGQGQATRPGQQLPPPREPRPQGQLPYLSPSLASYLHDNPMMRPHRQDEKLRFPGDLYTPRWVRGEGTGREGWCSLCQEGSWMQLKTSQYWYHVRFSHGVNSNTGRIYEPPLQLRVCDDSFGTTFGLCGECHEWIPICTPRRKRSFTSWFKHAHRCHHLQGRMPNRHGISSSQQPSFGYLHHQRQQQQSDGRLLQDAHRFTEQPQQQAMSDGQSSEQHMRDASPPSPLSHIGSGSGQRPATATLPVRSVWPSQSSSSSYVTPAATMGGAQMMAMHNGTAPPPGSPASQQQLQNDSGGHGGNVMTWDPFAAHQSGRRRGASDSWFVNVN